MQPTDLYSELWLQLDRLDFAVGTVRESGANYAQAYHDYRVSLATELLRLKEEGVPATTATAIARGAKGVAKHKYEELSTEAIYKANLEAINATKLKIRVIEAQLGREYAAPQNF